MNTGHPTHSVPSHPARCRFRLAYLGLRLALPLTLALTACDGATNGGTNQTNQIAPRSTSDTGNSTASPPATPELADMMTQVQRYSAKLGYAIQARNQPLAQFYIHETGQALTRIRDQVPEYEGQRIADNIRLMIEPVVSQLSDTLQQNGAWAQVDQQYGSLIDACNTCHTATQRSFIYITEPTGEPPYNQSFAPP